MPLVGAAEAAVVLGRLDQPTTLIEPTYGFGPPAVLGVDAEGVEPVEALPEELSDEPTAVEAEADAVEVAEEESVDDPAAEIMADACAGLMVAVLVVPLLELSTRISWPIAWGWVSMKAMVGPATSWVVARSRTLLSRG